MEDITLNIWMIKKRAPGDVLSWGVENYSNIFIIWMFLLLSLMDNLNFFSI